jgi:hypothetical protein
MRKRKVIVGSIFLVVVIVSVFVVMPGPRPQVIGTISPADLEQIQRLVRKELRSDILPKLEWDNIYYPRYVFKSVRDYEAQRILWVEVKPDGSVEVFAGVSKDVIRSEGYVMDFQKDGKWKTTGYGYWGFSNVAPHDLHVPPSP